MKKLLLMIGILLAFAASRVGTTTAMFTDSGLATGLFTAADDWYAPDSSASAVSTYKTSTLFTIGYTATDSETGIDYVAFYYRKGVVGPFTLFATDDYSGEAAAAGSIVFTASEGDGVYEFYTMAADVYGNVETAPLTADVSTILDTVKPSTVLTTSEGVVVDEELTNGGFESGLATGWGWSGKIGRLGSESLDTDLDSLPDVTFDPPSGFGSMARVGHSEDFSGQLSSGNSVWNNKLIQVIDKPNGYLSFYWRVVSFDTSDAPAAIVMANDREVLRVTGVDVDTGGYPNDSGWQRAFINLSDMTDDKIELKFYAGNTDGVNMSQSWMYLDEITTGRPAMTSAGDVILTASDTNGVASITYSLDNGGSWASAGVDTVTIPGTDLSSGLNNLKFYATDNAGNVEDVPSNPTEVIVDDEAPDSPEDLAITGISEHEISAGWTAPADLGYFTRVAFYRLKVNGAAVPNVKAPAAEGTAETFMISGLLSGTEYQVELSACDPVGNCSEAAATATTLTEHDADPSDVIINELQWMGTSVDAADEWLELRNMTDQAVDVSGWQLTKKSGGVEVWMYTLPASTTISANGYLLVSEFDKANSALNVDPDLVVGTGSGNDTDFVLVNSGLQIKLYDGDWTAGAMLIDTADDGVGTPAAGLNNLDGDTVYYSVERNATPGNGEDAASWHTTFSDTSAYFDGGLTTVKGTPGAVNQSEPPLFTLEPTGILSPQPTTAPTPTMEPTPGFSAEATPTPETAIASVPPEEVSSATP